MGKGYRRGAHRVRAGGATSPTNTARSASFACLGKEQEKTLVAFRMITHILLALGGKRVPNELTVVGHGPQAVLSSRDRRNWMKKAYRRRGLGVALTLAAVAALAMATPMAAKATPSASHASAAV